MGDIVPDSHYLIPRKGKRSESLFYKGITRAGRLRNKAGGGDITRELQTSPRSQRCKKNESLPYKQQREETKYMVGIEFLIHALGGGKR